MRLTTVKKVEEYIGKSRVFLVKNRGDSYSIERVEVLPSTKGIKNGFVWKYRDEDVAFHTGSLDHDAVFTTLEEAQKYIQEEINNTEVEENPAGYDVGIYKGGIVGGLVQLDNELFDWEIDGKFAGSVIRHISLNSIYRQAIEKGLITSGLLTVFYTQPMKGYIYVCGNYSAGNWHLNGTTDGYV